MDKHEFYQKTAGAVRAYLAQELRIEAGIHYQVKQAIDGPRVLAIYLVVNPRYANRIMSMTEQLSMGAGLDRHVSIRVDRGPGGTLVMEIPKPGSIDEHGRALGLWYNLSIGNFRARNGLRAVLGMDNTHQTRWVDFANPMTPHALVAGIPGSGKTNAQRLIAYDLARQNAPAAVRFLLIDTGKNGRSWRPFAHLPHLLHPIITDDNTAARALAWAVAEIDRRSKTDQVIPRVFLGIDEAQSLLEQPAFVKPVRDVARLGREYGIHLLLAMQNPTREALGDTAIKRNLAVRLVGKTDGADAAKVAAGLSGTGAEKLVTAGDMLLIQPKAVARITACLLTAKDTAGLPQAAGEDLEALDLTEYEDLAHVVDQADNARKPGRRPDPLDLERLGELIGMLATGREVSSYNLARQWGWFAGKVDRHIEAADEALAGLTGAGYCVDLLSNELQ